MHMTLLPDKCLPATWPCPSSHACMPSAMQCTRTWSLCAWEKVYLMSVALNMQVLPPGQFRIVYEHLGSRLVIPSWHRHHPLFDIQGSVIVVLNAHNSVCNLIKCWDLFDMRVNGGDGGAVFITLPTLSCGTPSSDDKKLLRYVENVSDMHWQGPGKHVHSSGVSPLDSTGQPLHRSTNGSRRKFLREYWSLAS